MRRLHLKRSVLLTAMVSLTLVVSGCTIFGGGIVIDFSPNPLVVCGNKDEVKGTLTIKTRGLGTIHVDSASAVVLNSNGDPVPQYTFEVLDEDVTIPAPFSHTIEDAEITDATYDQLDGADAEEIRLSVSGDHSATYTIDLDLREIC